MENLLLKCVSPCLSARLNLEAVALAQLGGVTQQRGSEKPRSRHCDKVLPPDTLNGETVVLIHHL